MAIREHYPKETEKLKSGFGTNYLLVKIGYALGREDVEERQVSLKSLLKKLMRILENEVEGEERIEFAVITPYKGGRGAGTRIKFLVMCRRDLFCTHKLSIMSSQTLFRYSWIISRTTWTLRLQLALSTRPLEICEAFLSQFFSWGWGWRSRGVEIGMGIGAVLDEFSTEWEKPGATGSERVPRPEVKGLLYPTAHWRKIARAALVFELDSQSPSVPQRALRFSVLRLDHSSSLLDPWRPFQSLPPARTCTLDSPTTPRSGLLSSAGTSGEIVPPQGTLPSHCHHHKIHTYTHAQT
uniref:Uncharacterized protein n=1 Tax=Timema bartmani TaxID=61472 RepID=A0A7R9FBE1_9NEOP|nr:unnamed protein product [Timema bartmani]